MTDEHFKGVMQGLMLAAQVCEQRANGKISYNARQIMRIRAHAQLIRERGIISDQIQVDEDLNGPVYVGLYGRAQPSDQLQGRPSTTQGYPIGHGGRMKIWAVQASQRNPSVIQRLRQALTGLFATGHDAYEEVRQVRNNSAQRGLDSTRVVIQSPQTTHS